MQLTNGPVTVKSLTTADAEDICLLANNHKIFKNLRDRFPHPYSITDAHKHIANQNSKTPPEGFGIFFNGKAIGSIGLFPQEDIYRFSAELGYWIGEPYWGKGIAAMAVNLMVWYGFEPLKLKRMYADVFAGNTPSMRVLEKCGFTEEGTFKDSVYKEGRFLDATRYAIIK